MADAPVVQSSPPQISRKIKSMNSTRDACTAQPLGGHGHTAPRDGDLDSTLQHSHTSKICMASLRPWDVSKEHILLSEINAVTATMRRNSRWASRANRRYTREDVLADTIGLRRTGHSSSASLGKVERQEFDLLAGFEDLRRVVREAQGTSPTPPATVL